MKEKMNNKGFSLVELIIVIAIMAVLIAVLAPQFLRYVERSRLQSDNTTIGEIANSAKVACSDEGVTGAITTAGGTVVLSIPVTTGGLVTATPACAALTDEITATVGNNVAVTSNTYSGAPAADRVTITVAITAGVVTVNGQNYVQEVANPIVRAAITF